MRIRNDYDYEDVEIALIKLEEAQALLQATDIEHEGLDECIEEIRSAYENYAGESEVIYDDDGSEDMPLHDDYSEDSFA